MRRSFLLPFLLLAACSRETPAPPAATTSSAAPPPPVTQTIAQPKKATYEDAMLWFGSANAFHFVVDEGGVHAEGDLTRPRIGEENVHFRANGEEWRATANVKGVVWQRRNQEVPPPPYGGRLYQRVTVAFDPQKIEGTAQEIGEENGATHYRFTNANTGEVHDVWVRDGHIERIKIDDTLDMKISA